MQCNCGGEMLDRKETKDYKTVATWKVCTACGRVGAIREVNQPIEDKEVKKCP